LGAAFPTLTDEGSSLVLRGTAVVHDVFLDGNTFRDSHNIDKKAFVGLTIFGLHYERENWSARFNLLFPTDTVDTSRATAVEGRASASGPADREGKKNVVQARNQ
jgi:hypothetical protein